MSERLSHEVPPAIAQVPYLQEHLVRTLNDARGHNVELDPHRIAGSNLAVPALAEHPPLSFGARGRPTRPHAWCTRSTRACRPGRGRRWARSRARSDYDHRDWPRLVEYADGLYAVVTQPNRADRLEMIGRVVDGGARLSRLDDARGAARTQLDRLVARAAGASVIRDRIAEFESLLRRLDRCRHQCRQFRKR